MYKSANIGNLVTKGLKTIANTTPKQAFKTLSKTTPKQRVIGGAVIGGVTSGLSTPTNEYDSFGEKALKKTVGTLSGAVTGGTIGHLATNPNINKVKNGFNTGIQKTKSGFSTMQNKMKNMFVDNNNTVKTSEFIDYLFEKVATEEEDPIFKKKL